MSTGADVVNRMPKVTALVSVAAGVESWHAARPSAMQLGWTLVKYSDWGWAAVPVGQSRARSSSGDESCSMAGIASSLCR